MLFMKTFTVDARLGVLVLAMASVFSVAAQTPPAPLLGETVITATRVAVPLTQVIADVTVIDRSTLDKAGQSTLGDVLAQQPAVQWTSSGGYRSTTGIFLRGASSSQTLYLVDGVRIGSATAGGASVENIPLDRIERIEIVRGAASALYGPDAVGGVVQIFTRGPSDTPQWSATAGAGTYGQVQSGFTGRGRSGMWGYSLGLSQERGNGINVSANPASSSYNADRDGFSSTSVDARLTADLTKGQLLTLGVTQSDMAYGFDATPFPNPLALTAATTDAQAKPRLEALHVKWDAQWLPQWKSSVLLGKSSEQFVSAYYRIADGAFAGDTRFNTNRTQVRWQNDVTVWDKDVVSVGVENQSEVVDSSTVYTVSERTIHGVMGSYAMNRAPWNALLVLRRDENSQFGHFDDWALSGGYLLVPSLRAVASMGTSFQAPSFNQLYYPGFGKPTLLPQMNRASELGLKYQQEALRWSAIAYYNEIQGFIDPATNAQSSLGVLRGGTLSAEVERGDTRYTMSYDYADPKSYSQTAASNDLRLMRVAYNVAQLRISHRVQAFDIFGEFKYTSDRQDRKVIGSGIDTLPEYSTLNLGATWALGKELSLLARLNNATDTQYMLANGYNMPGRNLFVSLTWSP